MISDQNYYFLEGFLPLSVFDIFNSYPPRTWIYSPMLLLLERDSLFTALLWPHISDQKFQFFKDHVPHFVLDRLVDMYMYVYRDIVVHTLIIDDNSPSLVVLYT